MSPREAQIVVLAKSPLAGRVKTRLTPPYTPQEAADLALAALLDTLQAVYRRRRTPIAASSSTASRATGPSTASRSVRSAATASTSASPTHWPTCTPTCRSRCCWSAWTPRRSLQMTWTWQSSTCCDPAPTRCSAPPRTVAIGCFGLRRPRPEHVLGVRMSRNDTGARQFERLRVSGSAGWLARDPARCRRRRRRACRRPRCAAQRFAATLGRLQEEAPHDGRPLLRRLA